MKPKLILCDLDRTLIDDRYEFNLKEELIADIFKSTQRSGTLIGLSSDTPFVTLAKWAKRLLFHGPLVCERGAILALNCHQQECELEVSNPLVNIFPEIRLALVEKLLTLRQDAPKRLIVIGDVNDLAQETWPIAANTSVASVVILINGLRRASLSFFVRTLTNSGWKPNPTEYYQYVEICSELLRNRFFVGESFEQQLWHDKNEQLGLYIVHLQTSKKASSVPWLKLQFPDHAIHMIGDSMSDFLQNPDVTHWAVGNASAAYKAVCGTRVSTKSYTQGVVDILQQIT